MWKHGVIWNALCVRFVPNMVIWKSGRLFLSIPSCFLRGIGETTDVVEKEMYTFTDRGERSLTLRPENTASAVRSYVENKNVCRSGADKAVLYRADVQVRQAAGRALPAVPSVLAWKRWA